MKKFFKSSRPAPYLLFFLSSFIALVLLGVITNTGIFQIDMRLSYPGDELIYSLGIRDILSHGLPQGWMTYNEVEATFPPYGGWHPVVFVCYAAVSFLAGGWHGYNTVMITNVLMVLVANLIFLIIVRPSGLQALLLALFQCLNLPMQRQIWSGSSEGLFIALSILFTGFTIAAVRRNTYDKKVLWLFWGQTLTICLFTAMRPYALIFIVFPLFLLFRLKKYLLCALSFFLSLVSFAIFYLGSSLMTAPYIYPNVFGFSSYTTAFKENGLGGAVSVFLQKTQEFIQLFLHGEYRLRAIIILVMLCLLGTLWAGISAIIHKVTWYHYGLSFGCGVALLLAMIYCYVPVLSSRHLLVVVIIQGFLLLVDAPQKTIKIALIGGVLLSSFLVWKFQCTLDTLMLPNATEEQKQLFSRSEESFLEVLEFSETELWANTINWDANLPYPEYTPLFGVPEGFSVGICWPQYLLSAIPEESLKGRYLYTRKGTDVYDIALEYNFLIKSDIDGFVLLENPNYKHSASV